MLKFPLYLWIVLIIHLLILSLNWLPGPPSPVKDTGRLKVQLKNTPHKDQLVRSEESTEEKVSEKAFLSDKTRSFSKQTKATEIAPFKNQKRSLQLGDLALEPGVKEPFRKLASDPQHQRSATSDYLPDIPPGDLTELNTVEFKYFGFYHRIREKLEQFWGRSLEEKAQLMAQQGRRPAGSDEHITHLTIILNEKGRVIKVELRSTSGVREFDEAAIESINQAGPFPNPPKGMIENGRVVLEWGFIVKT